MYIVLGVSFLYSCTGKKKKKKTAILTLANCNNYIVHVNVLK